MKAKDFFEKYRDYFQQNEAYFDDWSRDLITGLLGWSIPDTTTLSIERTQGNCYADLVLSVRDGRDGREWKTAIEIKHRWHESTEYATQIINAEKYNSMVQHLQSGEIQEAYLVSIWSDGVIWVSNIFTPVETKVYEQNETTHACKDSDGVKVQKTALCYAPNHIYFFRLKETADGKFIPDFSKSAFPSETDKYDD